jgi:hypothetical protein
MSALEESTTVLPLAGMGAKTAYPVERLRVRSW